MKNLKTVLCLAKSVIYTYLYISIRKTYGDKYGHSAVQKSMREVVGVSESCKMIQRVLALSQLQAEISIKMSHTKSIWAPF